MFAVIDFVAVLVATHLHVQGAPPPTHPTRPTPPPPPPAPLGGGAGATFGAPNPVEPHVPSPAVSRALRAVPIVPPRRCLRPYVAVAIASQATRWSALSIAALDFPPLSSPRVLSIACAIHTALPWSPC